MEAFARRARPICHARKNSQKKSCSQPLFTGGAGTAGKSETKDRPTAPLSDIVLVFFLDLRPYEFITVRVRRFRFFIRRPQITEGVVLRLFFAPPPVIAAPCGLPVSGLTTAAHCWNPLASCHPISPRSTALLKIKSHSCFFG
jgi:hypothetical protein